MDASKYRPGNYVIFDIKNFETDRLYKKFIKFFNSPFEILRFNNYAVKFKFPLNIKYNFTFYINIVKLFFPGLEG